MFNLKENWPLAAIVSVVSIVCVLVVQHYVLAVWQDPTEEPGSSSVGGVVTSPLYENLDLGGYEIVDTTLESGSKIGTVQADSSCCSQNKAAFYGESTNSASYAFYGKNTQSGGPAAYFEGRVGIGVNPDSLDLLHSLDITSAVGGNNAELTLQSGANNYWGIYNNEADDELRFWNTSVPGDHHALIINNNGTVEIPNGYLQIDSTAAAPAAGDCNASYIGRMILMTNNNRLYICSGNALGQAWRYATLN